MQPEPAKPSKLPWIILIVVVVLFGGAVAWYFLMGPGKKVETKTPTTTKTTEKTSLKTYTNKDYNFSIKYPSDFSYKELEQEEMDEKLASITFTNKTYKNSEITLTVDKNDYADIQAWSDWYTNDENGGQWTSKKEVTMGDIKGKQLSNDVSDYKSAIIKGDFIFQIDLTPSDSTGKESLVEIYKEMITSFEFTAAATPAATEEETSAPTTTDLVYENTDYGFTMTFPSEWDGYKFREKKLDGATMTYYVEVPTDDANFADASLTDDAGYYSPFAISVYTVEEWDAIQAFGGPSDAEVGRGAGMVFGWSQANGIPASDFTEAMQAQIQGIIDSFEVK